MKLRADFVKLKKKPQNTFYVSATPWKISVWFILLDNEKPTSEKPQSAIWRVHSPSYYILNKNRGKDRSGTGPITTSKL